MKKLYAICGLLLASAGAVNAQQLPNVGFETWKGAGNCGSSEAIKGGFGSASGMRQRPGDEPSEWNGSSVNQNVFMDKTEELITRISRESGSAVRMENKFVGVQIGSSSIGSVAPGFITLGTPWVNASTDIENCDGGTYGGVEFTSCPDAITGWFKRSDATATGENSHIIAYLWSGTFSSKVGQKNKLTDERSNVDRAVLAKSNAGEITGDGKLIASCDKVFSSTANGDWEQITVDLEYAEGVEEKPGMMNVIIAAGDYWDRSSLIAGTILDVDDVKFVYYSTLESVEIGGVAVEGLKEGVNDLSAQELPAEEQIVATAKSRFATVATAIDEAAATATITVTNQGGEDADGKTEHVYVLQFKKEAQATEYPGFLNIEMVGDVIADNQPVSVFIADNGDGTCNFLLPDLTIETLQYELGDIRLDEVSVTENEDGSRTYRKDKTLIDLIVGPADVTLNGTVDENEKADMTIDVEWYGISVSVKFSSEKQTSSVDAIGEAKVAVFGVDGAIAVDGFCGTVDIYTADGRLVKSEEVAESATIAVAKGLYLVRAGAATQKVAVK